MRRLLGGGNTYKGPTLSETSERIGDRASVLDKRIAQLDLELSKISNQMKTATSKVQQESLKKRALPLLKQKKMYERQRDSLYSQQSNIEQTMFAHNTVKDSLDTVETLKHTVKQMQKDYKKVNLTKIENLQDTMYDLVADANELQEIMSRSYDTPDYVDDDELLEELNSFDSDMLTSSDASYLDDLALPSDVPSRNAVPQQNQRQYGTPTLSGSHQQLKSLEDELGML